jgi:hypothetical protein
MFWVSKLFFIPLGDSKVQPTLRTSDLNGECTL